MGGTTSLPAPSAQGVPSPLQRALVFASLKWAYRCLIIPPRAVGKIKWDNVCQMLTNNRYLINVILLILDKILHQHSNILVWKKKYCTGHRLDGQGALWDHRSQRAEGIPDKEYISPKGYLFAQNSWGCQGEILPFPNLLPKSEVHKLGGPAKMPGSPWNLWRIQSPWQPGFILMIHFPCVGKNLFPQQNVSMFSWAGQEGPVKLQLGKLVPWRHGLCSRETV